MNILVLSDSHGNLSNMARAVERDTELACDEEVLTCLPQDQHAAYGRAILAAAQQKGATYET